MIIAAHIQQTKGSISFLLKYISGIATEQASVEFIVFCEAPGATGPLPSNCRTVLIKRSLKNSLLLHYWLNYTLPGQLKKYKASLFISENNACSLRTPVPQLMVAKQDFTTSASSGTKTVSTRYLKKYFPAFASKAARVCATNPVLAEELISRYPVVKDKTANIYHGLSEYYGPIDELQQADVLNKYTDGSHFFVCECNAFNRIQMVTVLKAFSIFKKRLKSSLQLVLINKLNENPIPDFHLYKYREEVQLLAGITPQEEAKIVAAAYAAIEISSQQMEKDWGLQCMQCEIPLVTVESKVARQLYEDAATYTEPDEKTLADQLMLLYKDETYRSEQIGKGKSIAAPYTWQHSSQLLWQSILQCS